MICKKDDLCYIRKALRKENLGLVVECKTYLGYYLIGEEISINGENWSAIVSDNYWLIWNDYGEIETQFGGSMESFIPDLWLEPIKTDKLSDDTKIEIKDELNV